MMRIHLPFAAGFVGILALVQGCSSAGSTPPDGPIPGEEDPGSPPDPAAPAVDKPAPAPAPATGGTPPAPTPTPTPTPTPVVKSKMTFFVTSTGTAALGGNLGGLAGADKKCQDLAVAVSGGDHTWHAYLSITGTNAKDRIGAGPWTNQAGKVIAASVDALHSFKFVAANADLVDEKGVLIPKGKNTILTGSTRDGVPALQNCQSWTSAAANQQAHLGDAAADTSVLLGVTWNDAVKNSACTQAALAAAGGEGRLYCFAID